MSLSRCARLIADINLLPKLELIILELIMFICDFTGNGISLMETGTCNLAVINYCGVNKASQKLLLRRFLFQDAMLMN